MLHSLPHTVHVQFSFLLFEKGIKIEVEIRACQQGIRVKQFENGEVRVGKLT